MRARTFTSPRAAMAHNIAWSPVSSALVAMSESRMTFTGCTGFCKSVWAIRPAGQSIKGARTRNNFISLGYFTALSPNWISFGGLQRASLLPAGWNNLLYVMRLRRWFAAGGVRIGADTARSGWPAENEMTAIRVLHWS